ncbi:hypothetical protein QWY82_11775 [Simiduia curdlanivorans]|uniref:Calcium-binding protein n=1 Tax=Simiduia curdlanivorans TaxID=1492769 RepID=A0ABV8V8F9_9GAMM|nr:hypothetical protein [Simiduia curdlanivorans]MDN3639483.1 hypothetical protein [Simiduia curdlanivorans]
MKTINTQTQLLACIAISASLLFTGCDDDYNSSPTSEPETTTFTLVEGNDGNRKTSALLSLNPGGPGGSPNQSLRAGDVLYAPNTGPSILIGGLGVDLLIGHNDNDILIGGTEDFTSTVDGDNNGSDNRDRAFGNGGDDVFIWSPGDGSDFFDGGEGVDVLIFGVLGEKQDNDGSTEGSPFFNVSPPNTEGSQNFDGIFLDQNNQPVVNVSTSPGFCSVLAAGDHVAEFDLLNIDHIIRFSLRGIADAFDDGLREDDDGLRVAISAKSVEFLVCTDRETGVQVVNLTTFPPVPADLSDIPEHIAAMIQ